MASGDGKVFIDQEFDDLTGVRNTLVHGDPDHAVFRNHLEYSGQSGQLLPGLFSAVPEGETNDFLPPNPVSDFCHIPGQEQLPFFNDADLVVEMTEREIPLVFDHFRNEFYVSMDAIREAVIRQRSFNLIHLVTMFKIDIFVIQPKSLPEMERRQATALSDVADAEIFVAAPEDVIVRKLMWYKLGNEVSAQQWQDVLGILRVKCNELDYELLMKPKNNTGHNLIFDFLKDIGCKNFVKLDHHVVMMLPDLALTPGNTKRTLTA